MTIIPVPASRRHYDFTLTMINIVFLLLLFFLTTGSITNPNEAQSAVPVTATLPLERLPRPLLLLQADGSLFLDGTPVAEDRLAEASRTAIAATGQDNAPLNVLAQREMPATSLLAVTDLLRGAGIAVRIVTVRANVAVGAPRP